MINWNAADEPDEEPDFLTETDAAGNAPEAAACPLNPEGLEGCEACQAQRDRRF